MTIKVERDVVLGGNLAQHGILWYEGVQARRNFFCLRQVLASCGAANRSVLAMHLSIGIARRSIGRLCPLGSSDCVVGHVLGVTLTSLSLAAEC
jgi:hypothetical protein